MEIQTDGDLLVVHERAKIPKVCVKCGRTKDVSRVDVPFPVGQTGAGVGAAGGAMGAAFARTLRPDPATMGMVFAAVVVVAGGLVWVVNRVTPRIHVDVPLCAEHADRLQAARHARPIVLAGLAVSGLLAAFGLGAEDHLVIGIAVVAFLLVLGYALATGMGKSWVTAKWARDQRVAIVAGPGVASKILERARRREERASREL